MKISVRSVGQRRVFITLLALVMLGALALPAAAAPNRQTSDTLKVGPVGTLALDNVGGGWGWTGPAEKTGNGHLIRLQNGVWHDVPNGDAAGGVLAGQTAAVYDMVLSGDGKSGWAIGAGGGQQIYQFKNGTWTRAANPFDPDTTFQDLTVTADGTDGWITAQDRSVRMVVARLRNGRWVRDYQPVFAEMRYISVSPDGKSGWGVGYGRNQGEYVAVRLDKGRWVDDPAQMYAIPYNSGPVTVDNLGNGWTTAPPITSALIRLTPKGARSVLPDPNSEKPDLYPSLVLQDVEVNAQGRGWATATYKPQPDPRLDVQPVNQPLMLWLDGDNYTAVPSDIIPANSQASRPNYGGPIAFSPDGAHAWLGANTGESQFISLTELHEPWLHDAPVAAAPLPGAGHCFAEVSYCLRGVFATYWDSRGGLNSMGFPITPEVEETINGQKYTVQYTQRARMEYHPEHQGTPYVVLLGLLGNTLADPRQNEEPFLPASASPTANFQWFSQTRHNVGPPFSTYWTSNGGLPVFGYPRSEAFNESNQADSKTYLVQYFERNRIEFHPENRGTQYEFLLGLLGVEQFKATYGYTP